MSPVALVVLGLALAGLLLSLLPDRDTMEQRMSDQKLDKLSLVYLELALHEHPEDARLRLLLARRYYELSRYDDAETTLAPLLGDTSPEGRQHRLLHLEIGHARCAAQVRAGHPDAATCSRALLDSIHAWLAEEPPLPPAMFDRLAQIGAANGDTDLAVEIYTLLAQNAVGDEERSAWRTKAVAATARPDLNAEIGRTLLSLRPNDRELLQRQIDAELAIGEVDRALALARRLVDMDPANRRAREQLATVADWAGRPLQALDQWAWLARHGSDPRYLERAMTLARASWDQRLMLELSWLAARARGTTREDVLGLADLYARQGEPETARALLARQIAAHPSHRPSWDALLRIQLAMADLESAARTWGQIHERFGTSEAEQRQRAALLWRAGHPLAALTVMQEGPRQETESLRLSAELAWHLEQLDPARRAYERLWRRGQAKPHEIERLMLLAYHTDRPALAMDVALDRWERGNDPAVLLAAMHMAADARRWQDLERLMTMAEQSPGALEAEPDYWRLRMHLGHRRLRAALGQGDLDHADSVLQQLGRELSQARARAPRFARAPDYALLRADVHGQRLRVAMQRGDRETTAETLAAAGDDIPAADRVNALTYLGRETEATRTAVRARARTRDPEQRMRLDQQAESLADRHPRHASGHTRFLSLAGLQLLEAGGDIRFAWERVDIGAHLAGRRLDTNNLGAGTGVSASAATPVGRGSLSEAELLVSARWRGQHGQRGRHGDHGNLPGMRHRDQPPLTSATEVGAGAVIRGNGVAPRLRLRHGRDLSQTVRAGLEAELGAASEDDALIRTLAMRDHLSARLAFDDPGGRRFASARLSGLQYRAWTGGRLGTGLDLEATAGYRLHRGTHDWNLRVIGLLAPRTFDANIWPGGSPLFHGATRLSLATTVSRGWPGSAPSPVAGRLRYFAELTGGWLVLTDTLSYAMTLGVGTPLWGRDELWLQTALASEQRTGLDDEPRFHLLIGYSRTLWH